MGLKVELHRRARSDLAGIRRYLLDRAGPQAAERIRKHLMTRILRLGEFPEIGVATNTPAIRVLAPTV